MENKETKKQYRVTCYDNPKKYDFAFAAWTVKELKEVVLAIVLEDNKGMRDVQNLYFEADIKNNKVKVAMQYDTSKKHLKRNYTLDQFGIVEKDYEGYASDCLRGTMRDKYGMMYEDALVKKFGKEAVEL